MPPSSVIEAGRVEDSESLPRNEEKNVMKIGPFFCFSKHVDVSQIEEDVKRNRQIDEAHYVKLAPNLKELNAKMEYRHDVLSKWE